MSPKHRKRHAFSLMELLAVVTILGIIAAIIVPRVTTSSDTAKARVNEHNIASLNAAVERYYIETGSFPSSDLNELDVPAFFPDGIPTDPRGDGTSTYSLGTNDRVESSYTPPTP